MKTLPLGCGLGPSVKKMRVGTMLHEFIAENREEIVRRCRSKVETPSVPPSAPADQDHGAPAFLDQLIEALGGQLSSNAKIDDSATRHGRALQLQGFTVSQVVHDYGDVCQSITGLALERQVAIDVEDFRTLNRCLDDAIALAVTEFGRQRDQSSLEAESAREDERIGFLTHEIRNLLNTAGAAFDILKTGNVGVGGSTGAVLKRSLSRLSDLVNRSFAEVRLRQGVHHRVLIDVPAFIRDRRRRRRWKQRRTDLQLIVQPGEAGQSFTPIARFCLRLSSICCRTHSSSPARTRPWCSASKPAPTACSSRSKTSVAACRTGMSTSCSGHSSNVTQTGRGWVSASRSAAGELK